MPAKNSVKVFVENGYYHLYNRGVEKRAIFIDHQDFSVFMSLLQKYLDPLGSDPKSLSNEAELIAYCLMPNHFHLLVKQKTKTGITKLIRAVSTLYVNYFNLKYNRVGTLFQGKYKAVLITNDVYLLHLTRYIHLNPGSNPKKYKFSSYKFYLSNNVPSWLNTKEIQYHFKIIRKISLKSCFSYQDFVENYQKIDSAELLGNFLLE